MTLPKVVHLIDDTTAGGVMRVLDHIAGSPEMADFAQHTVQPVRRGAWSFRRIDADVIVSHLSVSWRTLPGLIALRAMHPDKPLIHVEHSYTEAFTALNVRSEARFHTLLRTAFALFDRVVAVSKAQGRWLERRDLVRPDQISVIASTVDLAGFAALPAPMGPTRVIGAVGRLDRQKGFDTLIEAFRACPDPSLRLRIVGSGAEKAALEQRAAGDTRIAFQGHSSDPVAVMSDLDAVAVPSRWEAYGLIALEARTARRPVLVNRIDGLTDHLEAGAIGVADPSVQAWSEAITTLTQDTSETGAGEGARGAGNREAQTAFANRWRSLLTEVATQTEYTVEAVQFS